MDKIRFQAFKNQGVVLKKFFVKGNNFLAFQKRLWLPGDESFFEIKPSRSLRFFKLQEIISISKSFFKRNPEGRMPANRKKHGFPAGIFYFINIEKLVSFKT